MPLEYLSVQRSPQRELQSMKKLGSVHKRPVERLRSIEDLKKTRSMGDRLKVCGHKRPVEDLWFIEDCEKFSVHRKHEKVLRSMSWGSRECLWSQET